MREIATAVILLASLQAGVLARTLFVRRANQLANRILALLVAAVALMMLLGELAARFGFRGHPHLLGLQAPLPFLFGPLFYLYVIALTRPVVRVDGRWLLHALPFLADILYLSLVFYGKSGEEKVALALTANAGRASASFYAMTAVEVVQALVYLLLSWRALEEYGRKIRGYFSDLTRIDLRWLKVLLLAHVGVWCVVLAGLLQSTIGRAPSTVGGVVGLGSAAVIFLTGYVSLWQPELVMKASAARAVEEPPAAVVAVPEPAAPPDAAPGSPGSPGSPTRPKYQKNRLDDEEAGELAARLEALMTDQAMFRDGSLTLPTLADALGCTPHMLSQLLNVHIGKSFFVFVNSYRAEALKRNLSDPSRSGRGVLELALEVGFNSKSTLNSFFKKHTGMTPTEFRARAQPEAPLRSRA